MTGTPHKCKFTTKGSNEQQVLHEQGRQTLCTTYQLGSLIKEHVGHLYEDRLIAVTWILEQDDNWVRVEPSCRHLQLLNTEFHNRK